MRILKNLSVLLLVLPLLLCLAACSDDVQKTPAKKNETISDEAQKDQTENNETTPTDSEQEDTKATEETIPNEDATLTAEENAVVGEWKATYGYNEVESTIKSGNDVSVSLHLNEDRTGSFVDGSRVVNFTWEYTATTPAPNNPSIQYINFQCVPEGNLTGKYFFEIDTADRSTIYLTFGNWLYLCSKG